MASDRRRDPSGQDALLQKAHHLGGQGQEPQGVGDGWPGFAHLLG